MIMASFIFQPQIFLVFFVGEFELNYFTFSYIDDSLRALRTSLITPCCFYVLCAVRPNRCWRRTNLAKEDAKEDAKGVAR